MGNSERPHELNVGVREFIREEFQRVQRNETRDHIVLTELLQAKHPEDFPFHFWHLGILYVCDQGSDGVFTIQDLEYFALWVQVNLPAIQMYEFEAQLQARTVSKMIEDIGEEGGEEKISRWFLGMLLASHPTRTIKAEPYILIDSIKTIYEVFNIQIMTDMDIQSFFYLVKKSSEQMGFGIEETLENEEEQEYIPVCVCEEFIRHFLHGVLKLLRDIGFNGQGLSPK